MSFRLLPPAAPVAAGLTRRRFVQGLAGAGLAALWPRTAWTLRAPDAPAVVAGTDFDLTVGETWVNYTGRARPAVTLGGQLPGPLLRWREGSEVRLRVRNALPPGSIHGPDTSIHWHGILLPADMDGVPGLSFDGIRPGESYLYRFRVRQSGTYWYHSHSGYQEQAGLYGPLIIDPLEPEPFAYERDYVLMLSDWTDLPPAALMARLKKMPSYDNTYQRTVADFLRDAGRDGLRATLRDRAAWGRMRMTPTDLSDVNAHTYTYLLNGHTAADNWSALFRPGERVRLRLINGAAMTYFDLRIPGLEMTIVAVDGQYVHPLTVDELRIAVAETYDVIVQPRGQEAYTVFAQDAARTGWVAGTLATRPGLRAPVPPLDPRPLLSMADMGHGGGHAAPQGGCGAGMGAMAGMEGGCGAGMAHAGHAGHAAAGAARLADNPLVDMQAMDPQPRLDDPGVGLRGNGRRVATYGALRSLFPDPDGRAPGRELTLHLTGHMERFAWSFDGVKFAQSTPLRLSYGERVRIVLVNDTMMSHPIHLHGLWSDLEDADGRFHLRKHTVDMPPGTRRSYRVRADALGRWAYHCHLFFHMESGMFREVRVEA